MSNSLNFVYEKKIERTIEALKKNNMNGYFIKSKEELIDKINSLVPENSLVAAGGSVTLFKTGILDHLKSGKYNFLDRHKKGITREEIKDLYRKSFCADVYFSSTNALTESGELYNVDCNGNRVAAMLFGPDKVIVVVGINKIVKNLDEAIDRVKYITAPANNKRLKRNTPCSKLGYCVNCNSEDKICMEYTLIKSQTDKDRIHVLILNETLGY